MVGRLRSPEQTRGYGVAAFLRFDVLPNPTIGPSVKEIQLSRPELAFIIATRAILGAGITLLLADRLSTEQRKAVGSTVAPSRAGHDNSGRAGSIRQVRGNRLKVESSQNLPMRPEKKELGGCQTGSEGSV
jgi:hypothetical protein